MFLIILVLITALSISSVAIYYSVSGLIAIFAAAPVAIAVMGGALEIAKLVTAVWLHKYWHRAKKPIKIYLSSAVIILMFITSMGIFGFLSKAHIEQTSSSIENVAQVERIEKEINRQNDAIQIAEDKIVKLQTKDLIANNNVQEQIDKEQERIDFAFKRLQPAIDEQQRIIDGQTNVYQTQIDRINKELELLQGYIDTNDIKKAQGMIGAKQDGKYGPKTAQAFQNFKSQRESQRTTLFKKLEASYTTNDTIKAARAEIQRLRQANEDLVANSTQVIEKLQAKLGTSNGNVDEAAIEKLNSLITRSNDSIDQLTQEKYKLESEVRKLEAEVGPIKYIAEFIYGTEAQQDILEKAVKWMIITIIFVFDPLAVLLLIASQQAYEFKKADHSIDDSDALVDVIADVVSIDEEAVANPVVQDEEGINKREESTVSPVITKKKSNIDEDVKSAKQQWKLDNPNQTAKLFKKAYIQDKIDFLPWEKL